MGDRQRTILITGCSSGIGHACAHGMERRGWRVFATARKPDDLERLRAEGLETLYLEYGDEDSIAAAFEAVLDATGGQLDALFNNGGYSQPGAVEDLTSAALREQFDANFFGWHALTRRVIPVMRAQGAGRIVNNSSVLGLVAMGFRGAYVATKFALEGYTDALRVELEGTGIRVAAIEPGPIRSRMNDNAIAAFKRHIDIEGSVFRDYYRRRLASLEQGGNRLGQLEPEAVLKALVHACESPRPRPHYYVTNQTKAAATIRRLLPDRALHKVVTRFTG